MGGAVGSTRSSPADRDYLGDCTWVRVGVGMGVGVEACGVVWWVFAEGSTQGGRGDWSGNISFIKALRVPCALNRCVCGHVGVWRTLYG